MTAKYDLTLNKGSSYDLWVQYLSDGNTGIDLTPYDPKFEIKKYRGATDVILFVDETVVKYGCTGDIETTGYEGVGQININKNYTGTGLTGGIYIVVDANTTAQLPEGNWFYDLQLVYNTGLTYSNRILEGKIRVAPGVNG
jgi:hypothetical protein